MEDPLKGERQMVSLRSFTQEDAAALHRWYPEKSREQVEEMIAQWEKKEFEGRYFEMFAIVWENQAVGTVSLYEHSPHIVSCGPEVFPPFRRQGMAKEAMKLAMEKAGARGYTILSQQVRRDNTASIALHKSLGFEDTGAIFINKKGTEVRIFLKTL